jgi:hypothetical protein
MADFTSFEIQYLAYSAPNVAAVATANLAIPGSDYSQGGSNIFRNGGVWVADNTGAPVFIPMNLITKITAK